jgi:outer membrane protein TolC
MPLALIASLPLAAATGAQSPTASAALTVAQAVEGALKNYPSIRVSQEQVNTAAAEIQLARTAYLPRIDTLALVNRATRNNVFGVLLPQSVIPSMSGPVIRTNNLGTVWGSAVGVLVSWEPFDFGLRKANVAAASAARKQSEAEVRRTQFEVAVATADAYLTLVVAQETVRAAQAGVDRAEVVLRTTNALVNSQLRPGADASRADAELAAARTQLIQADEAVGVAQATVAQFVGLDAERISVSARALLEPPPERTVAPFNAAANPLALEQSAVIEHTRTQLKALERSYFPRFYLQGAAYSRGTGAELDGRRLGGLNGLAPNYQDYAVGFNVTFPVMDFESLRAWEAAQSADIRAEAARAAQIATDLRAQWNRAVATFEGSRRVAANTPVQVSAARIATEQATARYQSGLGTIDQVAEAQRLLTQAEIDDALARLGVWRALLGIAAAAGDIQPFVAEASR